MRGKMAVMVVGLLVAAGNAGQDQDKKGKDDKRILGTWMIVSLERGGEKAPEEKFKDFKVIFAAAGKLTLKAEGEDKAMTFKLDSAKSPKQIDVTETRDGKDEVHKGIYVLDKDNLKVCIGHAPDDRPTEFATQAGTKTQLIVLKREKK